MRTARIQALALWFVFVLLAVAVCSGCSWRSNVGIVSCATLGRDLHRFFAAAQIEARFGLPASAYGDRVVLWPDTPAQPVRVMVYACEECPATRVLVYTNVEDAYIAGWRVDGPTLTRDCPQDGGAE